jgi:hypothetical protein
MDPVSVIANRDMIAKVRMNMIMVPLVRHIESQTRPFGFNKIERSNGTLGMKICSIFRHLGQFFRL